MSTSSTPSISIETMPHPTLTALPPNESPSFITVRTWKQELYANAISVPSEEGGGNHGLLGEIVDDATYRALVPDPGGAAAFPALPQPAYARAVNPGREPAIPNGATVPLVARITATFNADTKRWETVQAVRKALKAQVLAACPEEFLFPLKDPRLGFANTTIEQLLTFLEESYGTVDADDHTIVEAELEKPIDATAPLRFYWNRITRAVALAEEMGSPFPPIRVVNACIKALESSGLFPDEIKTWRAKPVVEWTLTNIQIHFNRAEKERHRKTTAGQAGFTANAANTVTGKENKKPNGDGKKMYYCWSHGLSTNPDHTSASCKNPKDGHETEATIFDMRGGSNKIARARGDKPHASHRNKNNERKPKKKESANAAQETETADQAQDF
jgi:hypothetical protein